MVVVLTRRSLVLEVGSAAPRRSENVVHRESVRVSQVEVAEAEGDVVLLLEAALTSGSEGGGETGDGLDGGGLVEGGEVGGLEEQGLLPVEGTAGRGGGSVVGEGGVEDGTGCGGGGDARVLLRGNAVSVPVNARARPRRGRLAPLTPPDVPVAGAATPEQLLLPREVLLGFDGQSRDLPFIARRLRFVRIVRTRAVLLTGVLGGRDRARVEGKGVVVGLGRGGRGEGGGRVGGGIAVVGEGRGRLAVRTTSTATTRSL